MLPLVICTPHNKRFASLRVRATTPRRPYCARVRSITRPRVPLFPCFSTFGQMYFYSVYSRPPAERYRCHFYCFSKTNSTRDYSQRGVSCIGRYIQVRGRSARRALYFKISISLERKLRQSYQDRQWDLSISAANGIFAAQINKKKKLFTFYNSASIFDALPASIVFFLNDECFLGLATQVAQGGDRGKGGSVQGEDFRHQRWRRRRQRCTQGWVRESCVSITLLM